MACGHRERLAADINELTLSSFRGSPPNDTFAFTSTVLHVDRQRRATWHVTHTVVLAVITNLRAAVLPYICGPRGRVEHDVRVNKKNKGSTSGCTVANAPYERLTCLANAIGVLNVAGHCSRLGKRHVVVQVMAPGSLETSQGTGRAGIYNSRFQIFVGP
jgi:hypothetical protein